MTSSRFFKIKFKIGTSIKILILSLVIVVNFSLANDFSGRDDQNAFLRFDSFDNAVSQINKDDEFIFPLKVEGGEKNKEKDEKKIELKNKNSWKYIVKKNDTLWKVSKKFGVSMKEILAFNDLTEKSIIKEGDKILIPGVQPQVKIDIKEESNKKFRGKFVSANTDLGLAGFSVPVSGINWGIRHSQNGSDIAASCGEPVYASKSGKVIESLDGWNSGYGNYILIDHGEGVYSLYGHLSLRVVEVGDEVAKGELIGYVGNTGYTVGETGCHLHFEIRGKANPLLK